MDYPSLADQLEFDTLPLGTKELAIRVLVNQYHRRKELLARVRTEQPIGNAERVLTAAQDFED